MAKRLTKEGGSDMPVVADKAGLKLVRLELTPAVHKLFRVEAAKEGLSMSKMARRLVEEWIAKRSKGER
jgi:hypothetical protein